MSIAISTQHIEGLTELAVIPTYNSLFSSPGGELNRTRPLYFIIVFKKKPSHPEVPFSRITKATFDERDRSTIMCKLRLVNVYPILIDCNSLDARYIEYLIHLPIT